MAIFGVRKKIEIYIYLSLTGVKKGVKNRVFARFSKKFHRGGVAKFFFATLFFDRFLRGTLPKSKKKGLFLVKSRKRAKKPPILGGLKFSGRLWTYLAKNRTPQKYPLKTRLAILPKKRQLPQVGGIFDQKMNIFLDQKKGSKDFDQK